MTLTLVGLLLFFVYLGVLVLLVGWAYRHSHKAVEDYYLANRSFGLLWLVGTLSASIVNGLAVTGTPARFYEGGILYGQMFVVVIVGCGLLACLGPRITQRAAERGLVTQGELFTDHYGSRLIGLLAALIGVVALLPFLAVQIAGIGKIIAGVSGGQIPFFLATALCVLPVAAYVYFGGARAVIVTDVFQGLIALAFLLLSAFLFFRWSGGWDVTVATITAAIPEKLRFNANNTPVFIDNVLSWSFAVVLIPHIFQRLFMTGSPVRARRMAACSLAVLLVVLTAVLGMAVAATATLHGQLTDSDQLIATMYARFWPIGGVILILVIFALVMSTIDSMLLASSAIITRDLCPRLGIKLSDRQQFALARWSALLLLVLACLIALTGIGRSTVIPWVTISAALFTLLLWPVLGLFWRRASVPAVVAAMVVGFIAICASRFTALGDGLPVGFASLGFLAGGACFVVVSLMTRHQAPSQIRS